MALEEISFYNILGEEINLSNLVEQMIDFYMMKLEVGETKITDFNDGSEIRNLLETFAVGLYNILEEENEVAKLPFISTSYNLWLDRIGENPFIDLERIQGAEAHGIVVFTLAVPQDEDYIIPGETILVDSETEVEFLTDSDCNIVAGETTGSVNATCMVDGGEGNSAAGAINTISSENMNIDFELVSVSNPEPFEGGLSYEDDEEYRARLLANIRADGFGTRGHYKRLCEQVYGVHDVKLIDSEGFTACVLVNGFVKPTPNSVLLDVLAQLTVIDNIVLQHKFTIDYPIYQIVDLDVDLIVKAEMNRDNIAEHILTFFDGGESPFQVSHAGLNIDQSVSKYDFEGMFSYVDAVISVEVRESGSSTPISEIVCNENSVLKIGNLNITQTRG